MDTVFDEASSDYYESQDLLRGAVQKSELPPLNRPRIPTPPPLPPPSPLPSPMPSLSPSPPAARVVSDGVVASSSTIVFDDGGKPDNADDGGDARQESVADENGERRRRWRSPNPDLIKTPPGDGTDSPTPPAPPTGSSHRPKTWAPTRKVRKDDFKILLN